MDPLAAEGATEERLIEPWELLEVRRHRPARRVIRAGLFLCLWASRARLAAV